VWGLSQRLPAASAGPMSLEMSFSGRTIPAGSGDDGAGEHCVPDAELDSVVGGFVTDVLANSWRSSPRSRNCSRHRTACR